MVLEVLGIASLITNGSVRFHSLDDSYYNRMRTQCDYMTQPSGGEYRNHYGEALHGRHLNGSVCELLLALSDECKAVILKMALAFTIETGH